MESFVSAVVSKLDEDTLHKFLERLDRFKNLKKPATTSTTVFIRDAKAIFGSNAEELGQQLEQYTNDLTVEAFKRAHVERSSESSGSAPEAVEAPHVEAPAVEEIQEKKEVAAPEAKKEEQICVVDETKSKESEVETPKQEITESSAPESEPSAPAAAESSSSEVAAPAAASTPPAEPVDPEAHSYATNAALQALAAAGIAESNESYQPYFKYYYDNYVNYYKQATSASASAAAAPAASTAAAAVPAASAYGAAASAYAYAPVAASSSSSSDSGSIWNIFVGNLDGLTNESELAHIFGSSCGPVERAHIIRHPDGSSKGYGFVHFASEEGYANATSRPGPFIRGRQCDVKQTENKIPTLYLGNLPATATEADLLSYLRENFGEVFTAVDFKRVPTMPAFNRGFALVTFESPTTAQRVLVRFPSTPFQGTIIKGSWASKKDMNISDSTINPPCSRLYVGNFAPETTEDDLRAFFNQAGEVVNVTLLRDNVTRMPKGYAFIEFKSLQEAENACARFKGNDFRGRRIQVDYARIRDDSAPRTGGPMRSGGGGGYGGGASHYNPYQRGGSDYSSAYGGQSAAASAYPGYAGYSAYPASAYAQAGAAAPSQAQMDPQQYAQYQQQYAQYYAQYYQQAGQQPPQ